jgi:hypothetical protein
VALAKHNRCFLRSNPKFKGLKIDHSCDLRLAGEFQYPFVNTGMEIIELDASTSGNDAYGKYHR